MTLPATLAVLPRQIRLTYFPIGGRVVAARLAFALGGIPFQDRRVTYDEWTAMKGDRRAFPLGTIPTLEVDGRVFTQSLAINSFASRLAGLGSADPMDALSVEQALLTMEEIYTGEHGFQSTMFIDDPAEKRKARERFLEENLRVHCRRLSDLLSPQGEGSGLRGVASGDTEGSGGAVPPTAGATVNSRAPVAPPRPLPPIFWGSSLSAAELTWFGIYNHFSWGDVDHVPTDVLPAEFPRLRQVHAHVGGLEPVASFMKAHPWG